MLFDMINREQLSYAAQINTSQHLNIEQRRGECESDRCVSMVIWLWCRQQIIRIMRFDILQFPATCTAHIFTEALISMHRKWTWVSLWIVSLYAIHLCVHFVINVIRNYWNHPNANAVIYLPFDTAKVPSCQLYGAILCQTPPVCLQTDAKVYFARSVIACCNVRDEN